jgi:hypothetical protein
MLFVPVPSYQVLSSIEGANAALQAFVDHDFSSILLCPVRCSSAVEPIHVRTLQSSSYGRVGFADRIE